MSTRAHGYSPRPEFMQNLGQGARKHPACAHFPGTGPAEKTCADCHLFHQTLASRRKNKGRCIHWGNLRGLLQRLERGLDRWWDGWPTVPQATAACRYFWPRSEP